MIGKENRESRSHKSLTPCTKWLCLSITWRDTDEWYLPWLKATFQIIDNLKTLGFSHVEACWLGFGLPHEDNK